MTHELSHMFDHSTCLSRRQMRDYLSNAMGKEECHAVEHHLNNCILCSEALEGLQAHGDDAIEVLDRLNTTFISDYIGQSHPHIHLNAIASPARTHHRKPRKKPVFAMMVASFATVFIIVAIYFGLYKSGKAETLYSKPETTIDAKPITPPVPATDNPVATSPKVALKKVSAGKANSKKTVKALSVLSATASKPDAKKKEVLYDDDIYAPAPAKATAKTTDKRPHEDAPKPSHKHALPPTYEEAEN